MKFGRSEMDKLVGVGNYLVTEYFEGKLPDRIVNIVEEIRQSNTFKCLCFQRSSTSSLAQY